jgi:hypothetical protein
MDCGGILELVSRVAAAPVDGSRTALSDGFADVRRLRSWVEAHEIRLASLAAIGSSFPEKFIAESTGGSMRDAAVVLARARVVEQLPGLSDLLVAGAISAEHLDVAVRRLQRLEPAVRSRLLLDATGLAAAASRRTPEQYSSFIAERVRLAQRAEASDGGTDRLESQKAMVGLSWRLASEGMHEWRLLLDPVAALAFDQLIAAQVEAMFHDRVPEGCPTNPLQRQAYLRAHALLALVNGGGARMGRPEIVVVVDARDADADDGDPSTGSAPEREPLVDWGLPVEVPQRVLLDLFGRADVHTVVVRNGVVLHAPGEMKLGRSTRLASAAQRRALRALYATCGVHGCDVRFAHTKIHHVRWWRNGGVTDLDNLLPLCSKHHHLVHEGGGGWSCERIARSSSPYPTAR